MKTCSLMKTKNSIFIKHIHERKLICDSMEFYNDESICNSFDEYCTNIEQTWCISNNPLKSVAKKPCVNIVCSIHSEWTRNYGKQKWRLPDKRRIIIRIRHVWYRHCVKLWTNFPQFVDSQSRWSLVMFFQCWGEVAKTNLSYLKAYSFWKKSFH